MSLFQLVWHRHSHFSWWKINPPKIHAGLSFYRCGFFVDFSWIPSKRQRWILGVSWIFHGFFVDSLWIFRGFFVDSLKTLWIFHGFGWWIYPGFGVDLPGFGVDSLDFLCGGNGRFGSGFSVTRFRLRQNPKHRPPVSTLQQSTAFRRKCRFPRALQLNGKT